MILFKNNLKYSQLSYASEDEFEKDILTNTKLFFGNRTIYIEAKKKIESKELGSSIPDGFLFDLTDIENPNFYLVEIELGSHDFYRHIFPQITKFFAFFKSSKNRSKLVEKIFSIINNNSHFKKEFKKILGEKEIYKFVKDVIDDSQNILLILDGEKIELPEIINTYTDTWGKMVKLLILRKFFNKNDFMFTIDPEFEDIEYIQTEGVKATEVSDFSEEFHIEGVSDEVKNVYIAIKNQLLKINTNLRFNPQKYYISIVYEKNIAYFKFRKRKLGIVIMTPAEEIKKGIQRHKVKTLSEGIQKFYNGPCAEVIIEENQNLNEIITLFKGLITSNENNT